MKTNYRNHVIEINEIGNHEFTISIDGRKDILRPAQGQRKAIQNAQKLIDLYILDSSKN